MSNSTIDFLWIWPIDDLGGLLAGSLWPSSLLGRKKRSKIHEMFDVRIRDNQKRICSAASYTVNLDKSRIPGFCKKQIGGELVQVGNFNDSSGKSRQALQRINAVCKIIQTRTLRLSQRNVMCANSTLQF